MFSSWFSLAEMITNQLQAFDVWFPFPSEYLPVGIFLLRTTDITISTLRTFAMARGNRLATWLLALMQALFFITAVSAVIVQIQNILNLIAFAAGMATGNVLGITIEGWLAPGHSLLRVYSPGHGTELAQKLRELGHGATEISGKGQNGTVSLIMCYVPRRMVPKIKDQMILTDPEAYISVENVRQLQGGWRA